MLAQMTSLHLFAEGVDLVHTEICRADAISQLPLSDGSFNNAQHSIGDFLGISGCCGEDFVDFDWDLVRDTVRVCAAYVASPYHLVKNGRLIGTRLNNR